MGTVDKINAEAFDECYLSNIYFCKDDNYFDTFAFNDIKCPINIHYFSKKCHSSYCILHSHHAKNIAFHMIFHSIILTDINLIQKYQHQ